MKHSAVLCALMIGALAQSCSSDRSPAKSTKDSSGSGDATAEAAPVSIVAYDINCNETAYSKTDTGKETKLYLKISGATQATHSVGYLGTTSGALVSFFSVSLRSATVGSFPIDVLLRNKKLCKDAGLTNVNCDLNGEFAGSKQTFDTTTTLVFVFSNPVATSSSGSGGGILQSLLGGDKSKEQTTPTNTNRCLNGPP